MIEVVLDASVVLKWFRGGAGERHVEEARAIRASFESGALAVLAPSLLALEIVNVAGRRWRWPADALGALADALAELPFEPLDAELVAIARWVSRGLTAYDAAYVAAAEAAGVDLVSDDEEIVRLAPAVARPLAEWPRRAGPAAAGPA